MKRLLPVALGSPAGRWGALFSSSFAKLAKKFSALGSRCSVSFHAAECPRGWPSDPITNSKFTSLWPSASSSREAQACLCAVRLRKTDESASRGGRQELGPHLQPVNSKPLRNSVVHCCHGNCWGKHLAREGACQHPPTTLPPGATARDKEGISGTVSEQLEGKGPGLSQPAQNSLEVFDPECKPQRLKI